MRDHIDRAAEIIYVEVFGLPDYSPDAVDDHNRHSYRGDCECNASDRADARHAAEELDAAGLLVTPERDAEQRRAGAVEALGEVRAALRAEVVIRDYEQSNVSRADLWALAGQFTPDWLDSLRADRIEREAGESGADT